MTDIENKLRTWKEKHPTGTYETRSTIAIKTDTMELIAHGNSLEEAYAQIEAVCKEVEYSTNNIAQTSPTNQSILEVFGDKQPIRIYTPNTALAPGESTVTYNNTQYVVK